MSKAKLIVVGNGMVGHQYLQTLADQGGLDHYEVTVISGEPRVAYDRVHLSEFFTGRSAAELSMVAPDQYENWGLNVVLADPVTAIDRGSKSVALRSGAELRYDALVLATGSYPFVPPVPGHDREHCLVYRTIEDLEAIMASAQGAKTGVVVGGGLLGLEAAKALRDLGLETHVVEFAPRLASSWLTT